MSVANVRFGENKYVIIIIIIIIRESFAEEGTGRRLHVSSLYNHGLSCINSAFRILHHIGNQRPILG